MATYRVELVNTAEAPHHWDVWRGEERIGSVAVDPTRDQGFAAWEASGMWIGTFPTVVKGVSEVALFDRLLRGEVGL